MHLLPVHEISHRFNLMIDSDKMCVQRLMVIRSFLVGLWALSFRFFESAQKLVSDCRHYDHLEKQGLSRPGTRRGERASEGTPRALREIDRAVALRACRVS